MASPNSMEVRKCRSHQQAPWIWSIPIHPSSILSGSISVPPPLYGGFYLTLVSARLGMTLVPFWRCQSPSGAMLWTILLIMLKKSVRQDLMKRYLIPIPPPTFIQTQGIQVGPQSPSAQARWRVLKSPTSVHMDYQCFCTTQASMLPKILIIYNCCYFISSTQVLLFTKLKCKQNIVNMNIKKIYELKIFYFLIIQ